jgi:hypothetical protein
MFLPKKSDVYTPEKIVKYFVFNCTPEKVLLNFWFGMFCSRTNIVWAISSFSRFLTNFALFYPKNTFSPTDIVVDFKYDHKKAFQDWKIFKIILLQFFWGLPYFSSILTSLWSRIISSITVYLKKECTEC